MQEELSEFESNLAKFLGCKHAIGVADGTAALEMSLAAANLEQGDEVISFAYIHCYGCSSSSYGWCACSCGLLPR